MKKTIKFGMIGFGARGTGLLKDVLVDMHKEDVLLTAVCDIYSDRAENAADIVEKAGYERPFVTTDYKEVLKIADLDAVVISTAWEAHIEIAVAAMKAGLYVGLEVGGAYNIEDCWELVNTHEKTGVHCMLLENCCYGKSEMMTLNMVRRGVLGEIVHCEGGYHHDLRQEIADGKENRHYRLRNYINRNCENYPTHELGPIAKILDINNGNRLVSLTSFSSCAKGLHEYVVDRKGADHPLAKVNFAQGDNVVTVIKCVGGETIVITLDTTLPRAYSRDFTVRGTKGGYFGANDCFFLDKEHESYEWNSKGLWGNAESYEEKYMHSVWKEYEPRGGHSGMDWLVFHAFFEAVKDNKRPPIDVYDAATYMCIAALSEQSIAKGSVTVDIPDFTRGKWYQRTDICDSYYNLDKIKPYEELY